MGDLLRVLARIVSSESELTIPAEKSIPLSANRGDFSRPPINGWRRQIAFAVERFIPKITAPPACDSDGPCESGVAAMAKPESFPIEKIYVPVKRKKEIKPEIVEEIAGSILEIGQQAPILVRPDEGRFVLVEGLHRLEACKALGETTIIGIVVAAEPAHQKTLLSENPEAEAERDKMARLKKLRLEKEAAERSTVAVRGVQDNSKGALSKGSSATGSLSKGLLGRTSGSAPKTLSEWITRQKRDGGRY